MELFCILISKKISRFDANCCILEFFPDWAGPNTAVCRNSALFLTNFLKAFVTLKLYNVRVCYFERFFVWIQEIQFIYEYTYPIFIYPQRTAPGYLNLASVIAGPNTCGLTIVAKMQHETLASHIYVKWLAPNVNIHTNKAICVWFSFLSR